MKVQTDKATLTQVLQKVQNITEKKTNMPILANTLLKATDQQLMEFSATDLELSFWTQAPAQVLEPGSITLSARKLLEIVRELPQDSILLQMLPNDKIQIQSGRSRFELSTIPAEDFPSVNFFQDLDMHRCDASILRGSLGRTFYGIPTEEDSFSISGLLWHKVEPASFRFVSSDGHRLVYDEIPVDSFSGLDIGNGLIIPRKGVQEIMRVLEKETEVLLGIHEKCLVLRTQGSFLSTQLLEAVFPEYQLIIPEERPSFFTVECDVLLQALKRVAVLTDHTWKHVRFVLTGGALALDAGNPELGNANDALDVEYEGEEFSIAFNIRYVLDTLQAVDSGKIRFEWVDAYHGGVFLGSENPGYLSLIMPMVV